MPTTGLEMASKRRLQMVRETTPGVYDPAGTRTQMISITGGLQPDSAFSKFRPAGYNVDAWNALVRTHSVYSGNIQFDYRNLPVIMQMLCGDAISDITAAGIEEMIFTLPDSGERNIVTFTLEDGTPQSCDRSTYAFLVAISLSCERAGDNVTGSITILCKKPIATGVSMTGGVAQNEIQTYISSGLYGGGTAVITGPAGTGNIAGGQALNGAGSIAAALASAFGVTNGDIVVAGTSTAASGGYPLQMLISGASPTAWNGTYAYAGVSGGQPYYQLDPTHLLYFVTNTWYLGGTLGATTGFAFSSISAAATYGNNWSTTGGTGVTAPGNTGIQYAGIVVSGAGTAGWNGTYLPVAGTLYTGNPYYQLDASHFLFLNTGTGYWNFAATLGGAAVYVGTSPQNSRNLETTTWGLGTGSAPAPTTVATLSNGTGAAINVTATFSGATASNRPWALGTSNLSSVVPARTQPGSTGVLTLPTRMPMLPQHFSVRRSTTQSGLTSASPVGGARKFSVELSALAEAVWFYSENTETFDAHVDGADPQRTSSLELATRLVSGANTDHDAVLANLLSQPATPEWHSYRARHIDGKHGFEIQFFESARAAAEITSNNNVRARNFMFGEVMEDSGIGARFILRIANP